MRRFWPLPPHLYKHTIPKLDFVSPVVLHMLTLTRSLGTLPISSSFDSNFHYHQTLSSPTSSPRRSPDPSSQRVSASTYSDDRLFAFRSSSSHASPTVSQSPSAYAPSLSSSPKQRLLAPQLGLEPQDLAGDYEELAHSIEGLGYLESGITDSLNRFAATNLEWAQIMRSTVSFVRMKKQRSRCEP